MLFGLISGTVLVSCYMRDFNFFTCVDKVFGM
jgi:hypothetical protein